MGETKQIGRVTHFFDRISVAVVSLDGALKLGDRIQFRGPHTDFQQEVVSMQVEHEAVEKGKKGQEVAIKVDQPVRKGDTLHPAQ
jgi:putative protease